MPTGPAPADPEPLEGTTSSIRIGQDGRPYDVAALQARASLSSLRDPPDPPLPPPPARPSWDDVGPADNDDDDDGFFGHPELDRDAVVAAVIGHLRDDLQEVQGEGETWFGLRVPAAYARGNLVDNHGNSLTDELWLAVAEAGASAGIWHFDGDHVWLVDAAQPSTPALDDTTPTPAPALDPSPPPDAPVPPVELPDDERAPGDAYWTPDAHALACCRWMAEQGLFAGKGDALEPAIGGGAWARAVAEVWPDARIAGLDIDPDAPGLQFVERRQVGDFLTARIDDYDLIIGNPPYDSDNIMAWLERSLQLAPVVAYLLRETITGTRGRCRWWKELHRPSWIAKLDSRPKWEGPGARKNSDFADSVLVVWQRLPNGGLNTRTRADWIEVPDAAEGT